jgi:hypothetical protein
MTLFGVDVSTYQLPSAIPFGVDFVLARATFGIKPDKRAAAHAEYCRGRCAFGLYHFFHPSQLVAEQEEAFCSVAKTVDLGEGDLIPWIDVESPKGDGSMPPRPEWCATLLELAGALATRFGQVGFYISQRDWALLGKPSWLPEYPIWAPHWRTSSGKPAVAGGVKATLWQYRVGPYNPGALHVIGQERLPNAIDHDRCDGLLPRIVADDEPVQPQPAPVPVVDPTLELTEDDWLAMRDERDRQIAEDNQ